VYHSTCTTYLTTCVYGTVTLVHHHTNCKIHDIHTWHTGTCTYMTYIHTYTWCVMMYHMYCARSHMRIFLKMKIWKINFFLADSWQLTATEVYTCTVCVRVWLWLLCVYSYIFVCRMYTYTCVLDHTHTHRLHKNLMRCILSYFPLLCVFHV